VLLRDPNADLESFCRFSERLGEDFVTIGEGPGIVGGNSGRRSIDGYDGLFSVSGTSDSGYGHDVPLHGELYFHHRNPPDLLWFFCEKPATSGGETLLSDGAAIYAALPEEIKSALGSREIRYERNHDEATWKRLYRTGSLVVLKKFCRDNGIALTVNPDGGVTTRFTCSALRTFQGRTVFINNLLPFALRHIREPERTRAAVCFADGERIPRAWVFAIEKIANDRAHPHAWQAGDVAVIDNRRTLHGRHAVTDPTRSIYVRMSNAGALA
jgi:alpha-ketoglutarate-dependent taurine dioxygenase